MGDAGHWSLERGAALSAGGTARFVVWAPRAREVVLRVRAGGPSRDVRLEPGGGGFFEARVAGVSAGTDYVYGVDGRDRPDPVSRHQPHGVHGPSRVVDPGAFAWTDRGWPGVAMADLVLYELHVGTFTEAGTFDAVIAHLGALRDLGITAIELMPVAEFPGGRNWGYDGVHLYAPQSTYGGPEGLRRLVDAAHARGLAVMLDVVYNHLGPEGNYLAEFGPYFTDRHRTPWGPALNFDGADSDEVRRHFVENARYWVGEFHVDGLRLDAVHAIADASATHILAEIAEAVHADAAALGRRVVVIAESNLNDPRLVRPRDRGGYALDGQWSDDFHHAVHAALTGERSGYYADFGGVERIARALRERFVHAGAYSTYRRRRHGAPATDVPRDRFVVFVQNHDQVGNRARGDRLSTLVSFDAQKVAAALLLLSPYVPLLFMGEEYGETSPFQYFVSHGDAGVIAAVRAGRQQECATFGRGGTVPDPQDEATFLCSRLDRSRIAQPQHRQLLALHRDLLRLRREEPCLRPGAAEVTVEADAAGAWLALGLARGRRRLLAAFNLGEEARELSLDVGGPARWDLRLSTDAACYGGRDRAMPPRLEGARADLGLPGACAVVYAGEGP
jgi:maltooligosyltrehalose trehalohydrolase